MPKSPALWEPYCHPSEAEFHLSKFAGHVLGPKAGVIFFDGIGASRLKSAIPDAKGDSLDLIVATCRPPLAPSDPLSSASPQTINQLAQEWVRRGGAAGSPKTGHSALGESLAKAREFVEGHKTGFDTAAVVGDTFGVLAGVVSVAAIFAGGVALAPILGLVAGAASLLLLAEDSSMLRYELIGDEARKKQLESSWHYKLAETVGPIMVLPDLAVSGARTLASFPNAAREVGEAAQEAAQTARRLAAQRNAVDTFLRANQDNPERAMIQAQADQMRQQAGDIASSVREAQRKLLQARHELLLLRTIEAPAYLAAIYGTGVYGIDPPESLKHGIDLISQRTPHDPDHPANLLVPERPAMPVQAGSPSTVMHFHVGVSHRPERAQ